MSHLSIARFVIGICFLSVAALMDIRTRRVTDKLWIAMAGAAVSILSYQLIAEGVGWRYYLIFVPIAVLLSEAFCELPELHSESGMNLLTTAWFVLPVITIAYQISTIGHDIFFWSLLAIPIMMVIVFILYYFAILYGGADAKAVLVLAILVPFYPHINGITRSGLSPQQVPLMQILFPFTFIILLNASLIMLFALPFYLMINLKNKDMGFPQMLFGYKMNVDDVPHSFVWPMERYDESGERSIKLFPRDDSEDVLTTLRNRGIKRVWVTPKIPFIVPICIGFVVSFLIGNPISYML